MPLREMNREQAWLLPPTVDELVPPDHPARFVAEFVDALSLDDWTELGVQPDGEVLGAPAYHPRALLSVWLYGFMTNVRSCRKLEAACRDQIPYLWLTGWQHPDHNTLWRFYRRHRKNMRELFRRTVRTAVAMDLVDLAIQAVDGTKVYANAAVIKTYDARRLQKLLERVESAIESLEAQNEGGEEGVVARLPEKLADQKALRQRVRQAMNELPSMEPPNRYKRPARINLTDKDARLMRTRKGIVPSYNAQAMVSSVAAEGIGGMLVTASDVVDEPNDTARLTQMAEQVEEITGVRVPMTLADASYFAGKHVAELHHRGQQARLSVFQSQSAGQGQWPALDLPDVAGPRPVGGTPLGPAGAHRAGAIVSVLPTTGTPAPEGHRLGATDGNAVPSLVARTSPGAGGR